MSFERNARRPRPRPQLDPDCYRIGILCGTAAESHAVLSSFDHVFTRKEEHPRLAAGDSNCYFFGTMGGHHVVLTTISGDSHAGVSASDMRFSFRYIKLCLVVGVCGVVHKSRNQEIELGDVIISKDFVDSTGGKVFNSGWRSLSPLDETFNNLRTHPNWRWFCRRFHGYLRHSTVIESVRQPLLRTQMSKSTADSVNEPDQTPPVMIADSPILPGIFIGKIASGDTRWRSGSAWNDFAQEHGVIAFETDGARASAIFPTIVLKAGCDYIDGREDEDVQKRAAVNAAFCARAFVDELRVGLFPPNVVYMTEETMQPQEMINEQLGEAVSTSASIDTSSPTSDIISRVTNIIHDPEEHEREIEELEYKVYKLLSSSGVFDTDYIKISPADAKLQVQGSIRIQLLREMMQQLGNTFSCIREALDMIKNEGISEKLFSIVTVSTRDGVLDIIPISIGSILAFERILACVSELFLEDTSNELESGYLENMESSLETLEQMASESLDYLGLYVAEAELIQAHHVTHSLVRVRIIAQVLAIGVTSYVTSHIGVLSQTLFRNKTSRELHIYAGPNHQISFKPLRLACLQAFVGGPIHAFTSRLDITPSDAGYFISTLLADFDDLWGPVQVVFPSEDTEISSEIVTFGGRIQALTLDTINNSIPTLADEVLCHWSSWADVEVDHHDFDPTRPLLIGFQEPVFRVNRECTDLDRQSHYRTWIRTALHTRQRTSERNGTGYNATVKIPLIGGLGGSRQYQVTPQENYRNALIKYFYNIEQSTIVDNSIPACIDELVGLEISRCTGNALRISLWNIIRNPQIIRYVRSVSGPEEIEFPKNWISYPSWSSLADSGIMKEQQRKNLLRAISKVVEQIRGTGILKNGEITAWDVPNTEAYTFRPSWASMLSDSRHGAAFAFLSSRCLIYENGRGCSSMWDLTCSAPATLLTRIEITAKILVDREECEPSKFAPAKNALRKAPIDDADAHLLDFRLDDSPNCRDNLSSTSSTRNVHTTRRSDRTEASAKMKERLMTFDHTHASDQSSSRQDLSFGRSPQHVEGFQTVHEPLLGSVSSDERAEHDMARTKYIPNVTVESPGRGAETAQRRSGAALEVTRRVAQANSKRANSLSDILQNLADTRIQTYRQFTSVRSSTKSSLTVRPCTSQYSTNASTQQAPGSETSAIDWSRFDVIYEALQKEEIRSQTWSLDDGDGQLNFSQDESRCSIRFESDSTLWANPLRMIWRPKYRRLDPSRALSWTDHMYDKGDTWLKKAVSEAKRNISPEHPCNIEIDFKFRQARQLNDCYFNQAIKWVCVLDKE